jgi:6-phosphogluconate dehydrogenase
MKTRFFIIMGVSGCGKTSVGKSLAHKLGWDFYDADEFHSPVNITKMANGIPLTDDDRIPWLASLQAKISTCIKEGRPGVLACSALKDSYRQALLENNPDIQIVYLKGSFDLIWSRMSARAGHYMQPSMLQSQFDSLEEPGNAIIVDIGLSVDKIVENIMANMKKNYQVGILGLGVMGRSLAINMHRNGLRVIGFDPSPKLPAEFPIMVADSVDDLVTALELPRIILIMVPAGESVDSAICSIKPFVQKGDIVIDGGNSHFTDTERRIIAFQAGGISYIGMGVSGGESGALFGPCLMPGGNESGWNNIRPILETIAAKTRDGKPCVDWMGKGGTGHYIKMVHNGIEYADMQLIAEIYDLLHRGLEITNLEIAQIFKKWNEGECYSYLLEITSTILRRKEGEQDLVDLILDKAAQKGTGKWTSQNSFDLGAPIPTINAAVESRFISILKTERMLASTNLGDTIKFEGNKERLVKAAEKALNASKIATYSQGFSMLRSASEEYGWGLNMENIARIWRGGCIICSGMMDEIHLAFKQDPDITNLMMVPFFHGKIMAQEKAWRKTIQVAVGLGVPMPAISASLSYFDSYRSKCLPANLTQAQRDYFGAHKYHRIDLEGEFHTDWER